MRIPCSLLFSDWRNQSRLGPTDRRHPLGKDQEMDGESKAGRTSQTSIPGTIPYTPAETVLCNLPDTQCCGCRDLPYRVHMVKPPTCLWAPTVLWAPGFTIPSAHGEIPHMTLGINSVCRCRHLPYPDKDDGTSHMHLTSNSVVGAYHYPVLVSVGNKV